MERHSKPGLPKFFGVSWRIALGVAGVAMVTGLLTWLVWPRLSEIQLLVSGQDTLPPRQFVAVVDAATPADTGTHLPPAATYSPIQPPAHASVVVASSSSNSTERVVIEQRVIDAFSCARAERGLPAYERNDRLSDEADAILERVQLKPEQPFGGDEPEYRLTGQLLLDFAEQSTTPCSVGGFDVTSVDGLDRSSRIGVAVTPLMIYGRTVYLTVIVGK